MVPDDNDEERRQDQRAPIRLRVEYRRLNAFFADYTRNLSQGGTFITTETPLDLGTEFVFELFVPQLHYSLTFQGRVVWRTTPDEATTANPAGMGIEFQEDAQEVLEKQRIIERLMSENLGEHVTEKLLGRKPER